MGHPYPPLCVCDDAVGTPCVACLELLREGDVVRALVTSAVDAGRGLELETAFAHVDCRDPRLDSVSA